MCLALPAVGNASAVMLLDARQAEAAVAPASIRAGQAEPVFPVGDCDLRTTEIARNRETQDYLFVDVRSVNEFTRHRVPGSINIASSELKTKSFLKDRSIVLVDTGYAQRPLIVACEELRRSGFSNVKILSGGLHAWHKAFGNLEGVGHPDELRSVEPQTVDSLLGDPDWLVVELLSAAVEPANFVLDHPSVLRLDASKPTTAAIEKAANQSGATKILIAGEDERPTSAMAHLDGRDVFYIAGGLAAYREHLHLQAAIVSKKQFVLQSEASCR